MTIVGLKVDKDCNRLIFLAGCQGKYDYCAATMSNVVNNVRLGVDMVEVVGKL